MIVVKIELWPGGDKTAALELGRVKIGNDATGKQSSGNYNAALFDKAHRLYAEARVEGFPRKRLLAFDLLYRVLKAAVGHRNP